MTAEERITSLHERMQKRRRTRENRELRMLGAASAGAAICLFLLVFGRTMPFSLAAGMYTGSAMLFGDAGPFVLTAVVSFMAGTLLTVFFTKRKNHDKNKDPEEQDRDQIGGTAR